MGGNVKQNEIDEKTKKFINWIESKYECSGMCSPGLFYLTESVTKGPPTRGCFAPFMDDLASIIGNLGNAMMASGVFFLLMIFFVCPICCFKKHSDAVMSYKEGGALEMQE